MDIYDLLKRDHETVSDLVQQLDEKPDKSKQQALFHQLQTQLTTHSRAEEKIFYSKLASGGCEDLITQARKEHASVTELLQTMSSVPSVDEHWDAKITV